VLVLFVVVFALVYYDSKNYKSSKDHVKLLRMCVKQEVCETVTLYYFANSTKCQRHGPAKKHAKWTML